MNYKKAADFLFPLAGVVLGLFVVTLAIEQYPEFFKESRWSLPISLGIVIVCWIFPLFLHDRFKRLQERVPRTLWGVVLAAVLGTLAVLLIAGAAYKMFEFHTKHLAKSLKKDETPAQQTLPSDKPTNLPPTPMRKPMKREEALTAFFNSRVVVVIHPPTVAEMNAPAWNWMVDHIGSGPGINHLDVWAADGTAGIVGKRVVSDGYINPQPGIGHYVSTFHWVPLSSESENIRVRFKIDFTEGEEIQKVAIVKKNNIWLFAQEVTDARTAEILLACRDGGAPSLDDRWEHFHPVVCDGLPLSMEAGIPERLRRLAH